MKVYLNTNIYGRPFDDLTQDRILKESIASTKILLLAFTRLIALITSDALLTEISLIEDRSKRELIEAIVTYLPDDIVETNDKIIKLADNIKRDCSINDFMDCLHIASACFGECRYYITCDDELVKKSIKIMSVIRVGGFEIGIVNPLKFVDEMEVI
jgi:predicted nucleic-acid-binding protein